MIVYAQQGDSVDAICWRIYGATEGHVEEVLNANPGLAALGAILPEGTQIAVPSPSESEAEQTSDTINLWD